MKKPIKLKLTRKKLQELSELLKKIADNAPIKGWEVESCLLSEYYESNLSKLMFFPYGKKDIPLSFKVSEAFALYHIVTYNFNAQINPTAHTIGSIIYKQLPVTKSDYDL